MSLLIVITFLTFINAYAIRIVSLILKCLPQNSNVKTLSTSINELKKELSTISMVDEFARHAKLQRRINKLQDERLTIAKESAFSEGKIKYSLIAVIYGAVIISLVILVWLNRQEIVAQVPGHWLWPISPFFNGFNGIPGSITTPSWVIISSGASKTIAKIF